MDFRHGLDKFENSKKVDDRAEGMSEMFKGGAESGSGLAQAIMAKTGTQALGLAEEVPSLANLGAVGTARIAAPLLSSFVTGMQIGHYGDEQSKKLGLYHDAKGNAESASDWAAEQGVAADEWVTERFHSKALGTAAGLVTTGVDSVRGVEGAIEGAVGGAALSVGHAAHKLWDWL